MKVIGYPILAGIAFWAAYAGLQLGYSADEVSAGEGVGGLVPKNAVRKQKRIAVILNLTACFESDVLDSGMCDSSSQNIL